MEYENVPNPHVHHEFWLSYDYDEDRGGWGWEVEGLGRIGRSDDPIALLLRLLESQPSAARA